MSDSRRTYRSGMMSDDLVKRLRTPWDVDRSIISQTDNWMRERQEAADRIEELEAKLAKAMEALERIEDASKYFGCCPEASETTVRYAHETTRRLCSTTLAEIKGAKQ